MRDIYGRERDRGADVQMKEEPKRNEKKSKIAGVHSRILEIRFASFLYDRRDVGHVDRTTDIPWVSVFHGMMKFEELLSVMRRIRPCGRVVAFRR